MIIAILLLLVIVGIFSLMLYIKLCIRFERFKKIILWNFKR